MLPLVSPPLSPPPSVRSTKPVEGSSVSAGHLSLTKLNPSHINSWKEMFNKLVVPKNQYFELLINWAKEVGWFQYHQLISYCLDFVDLGAQVSTTKLSHT